MRISVTKSPFINKQDTFSYNGKEVTFSIYDINTTDSTLILLYMYTLPSFPQHGIKVGMTKCKSGASLWDTIFDRIKGQEHELALTPEQYIKFGEEREVLFWGVCLDAKNDSFKDYAVHKEISFYGAGLFDKNQEWFNNAPIEDLISSFKKCRDSKVKKAIFIPRKEQRECIDRLKDYFKDKESGGRFLLNCKMRFGKCFTTYKYAEEMGLDKILILTFVPAVESSWEDDLNHIEKEYAYYTDKDLQDGKIDCEDSLFNESSKSFVLFLSLQNYLGKDRASKDMKDKIKKLQDISWDLVILDEYHFGAWNDRTQETMEDLDEEYQKEIKKNSDVIKRFSIKTKETICLSGTPFKALDRGEFNDETSFTYSYFDEQKNKYPNYKDDDFSVVNPDYAAFPDMKIIGYNMSSLFPELFNAVLSSDKIYSRNYFSLNKFFETKKDYDDKEEYIFIYEEEVKTWLEIIKGNSIKNGKNFPYSNPRLEGNTKHSLWLLPTVNAVNAMAKLLECDDYLGSLYVIVNLSSSEVGTGRKALAYLEEKMKSAENLGRQGSITLTVNKLTIGVTVPKWSSVFVLKDLRSPEQYFQAIFRIQTPYKRDGKIIKTNGYVYDFNTDRAAMLLLSYAEKSAEVEKTRKLDIVRLITKFLPIYQDGEMEKPISEEVLFRLAEEGDTHGMSLSKKIKDTSKTTRVLDEETIAAMLSDNEVSEILKRVLSHAKFDNKKSKTSTHPVKPDPAFDSPEALLGRKLGHEMGLEDYKLYFDLDDEITQDKFDKKKDERLREVLPSNYNVEQNYNFTNGFTAGYIAGVNVPIKKLKCGWENGLNFTAIIKAEFGEDITWNKDTDKALKNYINDYLNDNENIPYKYRGVLYNKWYKISFINAIKSLLVEKKDKCKGTIEETDNILRHILSRLFEFLFISVYRETTFDEILSNANPDVFLDAVGITKNDFKVLNKYNVFQEDVLNGYIHEFFINESLGSSLDLSDEKIRDQYRSSFSWFGF